jgi:tRNA threonylcarbamoyladenosine biosynthesis protein TsaB
MRILALDTSTEWCSVAVGDGTRWHRLDEHAGQAHSERILPMVHAALAAADVGARRVSMALRSDRAPARSPAYASAAVLRRDSRLASICRSRRFPRSPRSRRRSFAPGLEPRGGVSRCADAGGLSCRLCAHDDGWLERVAPSVELPAEATACVRPIGEEWYGAGNGFAAYPALAAELELSHAAADARPTAQSIGELALPRLAAGEGVAAADAAPSMCAIAWR